MQKITRQKFPLMAGMPFKPKAGQRNGIQAIGYYIVKFTWSSDGALLKEERVKNVLF